MLKSFLGIDLKKGGQVILWIHLVENFLLFLIIAFQSHIGSKNANRNFIISINDSQKIDLAPYFQHFLEVFSMLGICFCLLGILIKRSRLVMWLYFFHQGIGIEVLIMLLPVVILKSFSIFSILSSIPLIILIIVKGYCWVVMISLYKHEKTEKLRLIFGKQWIVNSLVSMQPTVRLTIPEPSEILYEQLR